MAAEPAGNVRCHDQIVSLPKIRQELPHIGRWSATAEQQVLRKLDKTFKAFFGRIARGVEAGFPRFRARDRYHAADSRVGDGLTLRKSGKPCPGPRSGVGFVGVPGEIKVRWHRQLPGKPQSAILSRNAGKWYIIFHVEEARVERAGPDSIGIDMGLTSLIAMSDGKTVDRPNITKRNARKLRRLQRALSRCKRGSKVRRKRKAAVAKHQAHIAASRRDFLHQESRKIVNRFGRIAVEDLNIIGLARGMLAKHVNDAAWGQLVAMLRYKAESANCEFVAVDPRGTSQMCPECGTVAAKTLALRTHRCDCGCVLDRDVAAAMVVHFRAFGFWPGAGLGSLSQRIAA